MRNSLHNQGAYTHSSTLTKQIQTEWWVVTCSLLLLMLGLLIFKDELKLYKLDHVFYDLQMKLALPSEVDHSIALVVIDEGSLKELGYWPWRRAEHAKLLTHLHQAKAVGFDIVFQEPNPAYPLDDLLFAEALSTYQHGVLPIIVQANLVDVAKPLLPLEKASNQLGFINIFPDPDGVVRRFNVSLQTQDGRVWQHIVPAMLRAGGEEEIADELLSDKQQSRLIPFSGSHNHFPIYSFAAVSAGHYPPETFKDSYVLVGAWSSTLGDFYPTPLSWVDHTSMAGVEILANALSNAKNRHWISDKPTWFTILLSLLPVYLVCVFLIRMAPRHALLASVGLICAIFINTWVLLHIFKIWSPPTVSLLGVALAFPLWQWRSQEVVLRNLNQELSNLSAQHPALRLALQNKSTSKTVPARLSFLHQGIQLLRETQQQREQTLRFISHDMRAPQNSILALISMQRSDSDKNKLSPNALLEQLESYANTTLELVNSFMNLAHAEAVELELIDLIIADLISETCDDAWARAQVKNISLTFEEPNEVLWVKANPPMLKRALSNLIDNAIKYSPPETHVQCTLHQEDHKVVIRITDQGWGIPTHLQADIFRAFSRAHTDRNEAPNGSGIGLAFVETVIHRHQGRIELQSQENKGSTFTVYLPLATVLP